MPDVNRDEILRRRQLKLDEKTAEVLTRIYLARRIEYQLGYYQSIIKENEGNSDVVFRLGALVMTISSLTAALGTLESSPAYLRLVTALLPAFAAILSSFSQLYQWERQSNLYHDTALALERARLVAPDLDELNEQIAYQIFGNLVQTTEKVFEDEVNQWGQIALGKTKEGEDLDKIKAFAQQFNINIYDEAGQVDESKIGDLRHILEASQNPNTTMQIQSVEQSEMTHVMESGMTISSIRETTSTTLIEPEAPPVNQDIADYDVPMSDNIADYDVPANDIIVEDDISDTEHEEIVTPNTIEPQSFG